MNYQKEEKWYRYLDSYHLIGALVQGLIVGFAFYLIAPLRFLFTYLVVLFHEFGHALFSWIYGSPAIPAFDFTYGGGVTSILARNNFILGLSFIIQVFLLWQWRRIINYFVPLLLFFIFFLFTVFDEGRTDMVRIYMGHGSEILIAAIFLYRGLSMSAIENYYERPVYIGCALFITLVNIDFCRKLMQDDYYIGIYLEGKGNMMNDFHLLSEQFFNCSLKNMALGHLLLTLIFPVGAVMTELLRRWVKERQEQ